MKFLRNLVAAILGFFIAIGLLFFVLIAIVGVLSESEKVVVKENTVLEINLKNALKDYDPKSDDPFEEIMGLNKDKMGLNQVLNAIENAKSDDKIKGISIEGISASVGIAQLQAIRKKLESFKESGKFINSYADMYTQKGYYISSVSDSVFINPLGGIDFGGLSSEVMFYKDLQEKTGIKYEVIRHGKYKSAVEPFLSNKMSEANREQITSFLSSIWQQMLQDVSKSRKKSIEELIKIADNLLARTPKLATQNNLVDGIIYKDEYTNKLKKAVEIDTSDELNKLSLSDYVTSGKGRIISTAKDRVAVLYAQGEIIYGKGNEDRIGQGLMVEALKKIQKDKKVKALVLRVNSPGGSALASELIWRELELIKEKMPVVVSMGNLAASGGYYISCGADKIYAEPTTITGSIGVFGILPNMYELSKKIGINSERVSTNKSPNYSFLKPLSNEFKEIATEGVENIYTTFVERVSKGRNMSVEAVDAISQGRVWSGIEAQKNGLVDEIGSLQDAIVCASELAEIDEYKIRNYPSYKKDFEEMFKLPFARSKEKIIREELGAMYHLYRDMKYMSQMEGVQAHLPFIIHIK